MTTSSPQSSPSNAISHSSKLINGGHMPEFSVNTVVSVNKRSEKSSFSGKNFPIAWYLSWDQEEVETNLIDRIILLIKGIARSKAGYKKNSDGIGSYVYCYFKDVSTLERVVDTALDDVVLNVDNIHLNYDRLQKNDIVKYAKKVVMLSQA